MFKTQINRLLLAVVLVNLCALVGCHRSYYRRQADAEARRLIREKAVDPRWDTADGTITVDPQSRMFDPFSQDHPPIPADDASSHQFMHRVDGKEGYPHWHANGDTNFIESPEWKSFLPTNEKGQVVLTLEGAYQLALLHSPDYQQQRETLYLSALDVSLQRFGFDSQLFTGFNSFLTTQGRLRNGTGRSSTTLQNQIGANGGGLNLQKLGITGTNFAVGLANTILFNFAGNNTQSASSLIDFSIIQPLLRGAGRDRIMESLTQSERTLLANVRQMERFRRGFYLEVAIGRNAGAGPNLGGNFLGTPGGGGRFAGGFVGLLQTQQQIRNAQFNVRQFEGLLEQFNEFFAADRLDAVELKLFENRVYENQRGLLDLLTDYQTALDRFKVQLGLPPDLEVVIDDSYLERFELVSDQLNERLFEISRLRNESGNALNKIEELFEGIAENADLDALEEGRWPDEIAATVEQLLPYISEAEKEIEKLVEKDFKQVTADFRKMEAVTSDRAKYLAKLRSIIESGQIISNIDTSLIAESSLPRIEDLNDQLFGDQSEGADETAVARSIAARVAEVKAELMEVRTQVNEFEATEAELSREDLREYLTERFQKRIPFLLSQLNSVTLDLSLLQAIARSNSISVADVSIRAEEAIEVARCLRRDWMNARASHVDNWRNIEFVADQLEAQVDLVFQGDIGNTGDNPFKLRYETGQLRGGFRFDAPIVRLAERNQYRQALINYQQSRRQFYQFEDSIKTNLRDLVRNIDRNKILFELNRRVVQTSIQNVEINRFRLEAPRDVGAQGGGGADNTARNLADAISGLNGAQNAFLGSWVQLEVLRRNLDFDMGTMVLDDQGEWVDPGEIDSDIGMRIANMFGIELDCQYCQEMMNSMATSITAFTSGGPATDPVEPFNEAIGDEATELPFETEEAISPENSAMPELNAPIEPTPDFGRNDARQANPKATLARAPGLWRQQAADQKFKEALERARAGLESTTVQPAVVAQDQTAVGSVADQWSAAPPAAVSVMQTPVALTPTLAAPPVDGPLVRAIEENPDFSANDRSPKESMSQPLEEVPPRILKPQLDSPTELVSSTKATFAVPTDAPVAFASQASNLKNRVVLATGQAGAEQATASVKQSVEQPNTKKTPASSQPVAKSVANTAGSVSKPTQTVAPTTQVFAASEPNSVDTPEMQSRPRSAVDMLTAMPDEAADKLTESARDFLRTSESSAISTLPTRARIQRQRENDQLPRLTAQPTKSPATKQTELPSDDEQPTGWEPPALPTTAKATKSVNNGKSTENGVIHHSPPGVTDTTTPDEFKWKEKPSSLGGILNRFGG